MHRASVVPYNQVANFPIVRPDKTCLRHMIEERPKQLAALRFANAYDVLCQVGTDVERFAPCVGVSTNDRMVNQFRGILAFDMMAMDSTHPFEPCLEVCVKPLIGSVAVTPLRGPAP